MDQRATTVAVLAAITTTSICSKIALSLHMRIDFVPSVGYGTTFVFVSLCWSYYVSEILHTVNFLVAKRSKYHTYFQRMHHLIQSFSKCTKCHFQKSRMQERDEGCKILTAIWNTIHDAEIFNTNINSPPYLTMYISICKNNRIRIFARCY